MSGIIHSPNVQLPTNSSMTAPTVTTKESALFARGSELDLWLPASDLMSEYSVPVLLDRVGRRQFPVTNGTVAIVGGETVIDVLDSPAGYLQGAYTIPQNCFMAIAMNVRNVAANACAFISSADSSSNRLMFHLTSAATLRLDHAISGAGTSVSTGSLGALATGTHVYWASQDEDGNIELGVDSPTALTTGVITSGPHKGDTNTRIAGQTSTYSTDGQYYGSLIVNRAFLGAAGKGARLPYLLALGELAGVTITP